MKLITYPSGAEVRNSRICRICRPVVVINWV